jgi:hypothetical protein
MKAGDVDGLWSRLETSLRYVPARVQFICSNMS